MCRSCTCNFTQTTPQMRTACTHTHSYVPLAEVWLSLCQRSQNLQLLHNFLRISLELNLIHTRPNTYKMQSKFNLHRSVDHGFHNCCFQVSPPKPCTQFSPWHDPQCWQLQELSTELKYSLGTLYGWKVSWLLGTTYCLRKLITICIDIHPCAPWNASKITVWGCCKLMLHQNKNNRQQSAIWGSYRQTRCRSKRILWWILQEEDGRVWNGLTLCGPVIFFSKFFTDH
jgi:hypothetical protein